MAKKLINRSTYPKKFIFDEGSRSSMVLCLREKCILFAILILQIQQFARAKGKTEAYLWEILCKTTNLSNPKSTAVLDCMK